MTDLIQFTSGAVMMACCVAGLFFLRFYSKTGDRFFLMFSLAFWILGINRVALAFTMQTDEIRLYLYIVRLVAFLLILIAIIDKNLARRAPAQDGGIQGSPGTALPEQGPRR